MRACIKGRILSAQCKISPWKGDVIYWSPCDFGQFGALTLGRLCTIRLSVRKRVVNIGFVSAFQNFSRATKKFGVYCVSPSGLAICRSKRSYPPPAAILRPGPLNGQRSIHLNWSAQWFGDLLWECSTEVLNLPMKSRTPGGDGVRRTIMFA